MKYESKLIRGRFARHLVSLFLIVALMLTGSAAKAAHVGFAISERRRHRVLGGRRGLGNHLAGTGSPPVGRNPRMGGMLKAGKEGRAKTQDHPGLLPRILSNARVDFIVGASREGHIGRGNSLTKQSCRCSCHPLDLARLSRECQPGDIFLFDRD